VPVALDVEPEALARGPVDLERGDLLVAGVVADRGIFSLGEFDRPFGVLVRGREAERVRRFERIFDPARTDFVAALAVGSARLVIGIAERLVAIGAIL
jgi:hypothetical protein